MWSAADPVRLVLEMGAGGAEARATSHWPPWGAGTVGGAVRRRPAPPGCHSRGRRPVPPGRSTFLAGSTRSGWAAAGGRAAAA